MCDSSDIPTTHDATAQHKKNKLHLWHYCAAESTLQTYELSKRELIRFLCIVSLLRILFFTIYNNTEPVAYESLHMILM